MLGLRLDPLTEARLVKLAGQLRRSRSDIARDALLRYLDGMDGSDALRRQVAAVAAFEASDPDDDEADFLAASLGDLLADES